jgi:hydrogenase expression/formation protein HypC
MCLGIPMRVVSTSQGAALCEADGEARNVSTMLVGDGAVVPGAHLLVHAGAAVRVIDADEARLIGDALRAVLAAAEGRDYTHLIADLVDREPPLPPHLRAAAAEGGTA